PVPRAGELAPGRSYVYDTVARETRVQADGLAPPSGPVSGFARKVGFDISGRLVSDTDATGRSTTSAWVDDTDLVASSTDSAGRRTTFAYDSAQRLADTYGPAPQACFDSAGIPDAACAAPHASSSYDGGIDGLAASYWANPNRSGPPALHDTLGSAGGGFSAGWAAAPPSGPLGTSTWSVRLTGEVVFATAASYEFTLAGSGARALWVDDGLVPDGASVAGGAGSRHRVAVEYAASPTPSLELQWRPSGVGSYAAVPASALAPAYGLPTLTTVDDATAASPPRITATGYATPHLGLPTSFTADPAGPP
ncbi:MAG: hypothetical protein LC708_00185, partial [Actinobacteria bacterium]|nr:hypothetical protein [Actinomycetota bacterium]